nr:hypothetical protein BaRGS_028367 [Batillaria attramentaria]
MCETEQVSGLLVAVPQKPVKAAPPGSRSVLYDSDVRDDAAQQHVLYCLRELADDLKQALFVLSQINFGDYLGSPCYSAAAKLFPRPTDLTLKKQQLDRGDFDVIVISRYHGLLAGEIKAIGHKRGEWTSQQLEAELIMTLRKMWLTKSGKPKKLGQLGKAKQLRSALEKDAVLKQVQILHEALDMVFLAGPPGTGKTVMLELIALQWLRLVRRGLRKHVPVRVVGNKDQDALAEVAAHAGPDEVVFVNEKCTSQLIWVVCHNRGSLCDCENIGFSSLECQAKESNVQTD